MSFRRLGALVAALSIAFIPVVGKAADSVTAPTPGMTGSVIDAQAQADALKDIPANSWAYQAIVDLVNDGIIIGYPDGTFKGNRPLTRYEAAVLVERAVQYLTKKLANPATAPQVTQADIDRLRALLDEFKGDIDSLKLRVSDIDDRLKKVEATQDRAKLGLVYLIRPGTFQDQVSAYNGDGRALLPNVPLVATNGQTQVGPGGNVAANRYLSGQNNTGYGYQLLRILLDGNLDKRTSYHIRVENVYNWDTSNAFQTGGISGASTASTTGAFSTVSTTAGGGAATSSPNFTGGSYPRSTGIRFNYGYLQYNDPSGVFVEAGRINETDGTLGLAWADQFNGGEVGYAKGPINARAAYFFDYPALNNVGGLANGISPASCRGVNSPAPLTPATSTAITTSIGAIPCGVTTQTILASVQGSPLKTVTVGASYEDDINSVINSWNPSVCYTGTRFCTPAAVNAACAPGSNCAPFGLYQNVVANISVGSLFGRYADPNIFGKGFGLSLEGEGLIRFGNDPFTGTRWKQNTSYWVQGKLGGYAPRANAAYLEAAWISSGLNSNNAHTAIVNGVNYEGQFIGNPNGYQIGYIGAHYWFSSYGRVGIIYNYYDLQNNTTYPVGSATCPGCFLTHDLGQALFLQTYLQF